MTFDNYQLIGTTPQMWPPIPDDGKSAPPQTITPEERSRLSSAIIKEEAKLCIKTAGDLARQFALIQLSDNEALKITVPQLREILNSIDKSIKGMEESIKNL